MSNRKRAQKTFEEAEEAFFEAEDEDAFDEAWQKIGKALEQARAAKDAELLSEAWLLVLTAFVELPDERRNAAKALLAQAKADLEADDPLVPLARGLVAFYSADWSEAAKSFAHALEQEADDPFVVHYHGCALERTGDKAGARRELERAAELDPDAYVKPSSITSEALDKTIESALAELPHAIGASVGDECVILVEDFPDERLVKEGVDPLALGLFRGRAHGERTTGGAGMGGSLGEVLEAEGPAEVIVYARNLEKVCESEDELADELRVTLLHEIGHALGFDEEGVDELGLG